MRLILFHPRVAYRTCDECRGWLFDEETGRRLERGGRALPRPAGVPTPCWNCPKGSPEEARETELSFKNRAALQFYREIRGTCGAALMHDGWGSDPIVRRNAAILHDIFEEYRRESRERNE